MPILFCQVLILAVFFRSSVFFFLSPNKSVYKTITATVMERIITSLSFHNVFIAYHEVYNEYKMFNQENHAVTSKRDSISRVTI